MKESVRLSIDMPKELHQLLQAAAKKNKRNLQSFGLEVLAQAVGRRDLAQFGSPRVRQKAIGACERGLELLRHNQPVGWLQVFQGIRELLFVRDVVGAKKYLKALNVLFSQGVKPTISTEKDLVEMGRYIEEQETSIYLERMECWRAGPPEREGAYALLRGEEMQGVNISSPEDPLTRDQSIDFCHLLSALPKSRRLRAPDSLDQLLSCQD